MVSTADGAAAGGDDRSGTINTPADHVVFELLRALSDAVLVGAGTARAEGYRPLRSAREHAAVRAEHGLPGPLALVLVSRTGNVPTSLRQQSDDAPVHVVLPESGPVDRLRVALGREAVHVCGHADVDLPEAIASLHGVGLTRMLTEGGPSLLGALLRAGLVDELDLTVTPLVCSGPAPRIVTGAPLDQPARLKLHTLLEGENSLLARWLVHRSR